MSHTLKGPLPQPANILGLNGPGQNRKACSSPLGKEQAFQLNPKSASAMAYPSTTWDVTSDTSIVAELRILSNDFASVLTETRKYRPSQSVECFSQNKAQHPDAECILISVPRVRGSSRAKPSVLPRKLPFQIPHGRKAEGRVVKSASLLLSLISSTFWFL